MLDDFRQQADSVSFFDEEEFEFEEVEVQTKRYLLGMTPVQRFIISAMLLVIVLLMGSLGLLVTGRVLLPFL